MVLHEMLHEGTIVSNAYLSIGGKGKENRKKMRRSRVPCVPRYSNKFSINWRKLKIYQEHEYNSNSDSLRIEAGR